jgi:hypothetical protein
MIEYVACGGRAQRGSNADRTSDNAKSEAKSAGVARNVGDDKRKGHSEDGGGNAVQNLHGNDEIGVEEERKA